MRKSRIAAGLGVVVATTALAACGGVNTGVSSTDTGAGQSAEGSASESTAVPESCLEDGALIGVLLPNQTNPYYVAMKTGFEEGAAEHGFTAEVAIADDDDAQQLAQAEAMLQKNLCALALNPVKSEPAAAIVKAANDKNVPVFTVNVIVDEAALDAQGAHIVQYLGWRLQQAPRLWVHAPAQRHGQPLAIGQRVCQLQKGDRLARAVRMCRHLGFLYPGRPLRHRHCRYLHAVHDRHHRGH